MKLYLLVLFLIIQSQLFAQCTFSDVQANVCSGSSTPIITAPNGITFSWSSPSIIPSATVSGATNGVNQSVFSQTLSNTSLQSSTVTYTITPTGAGCSVSSQFTAVYAVSPLPIVNSLPNQSICSGQSTQPIAFNGPISGTTFSPWSNTEPLIGLPNSGNGNIQSFIGLNTSTSDLTADIIIRPQANGCFGALTTVTSITVKPIPQAFGTPQQSICAGLPSNAIVFTSNLNGTSFNWTNTNSQIGLASTGTGELISSFTTANPTNNILTGVVSVTPVLNGCTGTTIEATQIIVRPIPTVTTLPNQSICNGGQTTSISFSGPVANTTFSNWTSTGVFIGIPSEGSGTISPIVVSNSGSAPISTNIMITPSANGCNGNSTLVTSITVRPSPTVNALADLSVCTNDLVNVSSFSSNIPNAVFNWQNTNPTIGLPSQGTGSIQQFQAQNSESFSTSGFITVNAAEPGCAVGQPISFSITVKPLPILTFTSDTLVICSGSTINQIDLSSSISNTMYQWQNNNSDNILLPVSGTNFPLEAFEVQNITNEIIFSSISFTPVFNGCSGTAKDLAFEINPLPSLIGLEDFTLCNGQIAEEINFSSTIEGSTIFWQSTNPSIGIPPSGNDFLLPSFEAVNESEFLISSQLIIELTSPLNCTSSFIRLISVLPNAAVPDASFSYSSDNLNYTFLLESTLGVESAEWNFGDGNTSTEINPSHVYAQNGNYTVSVTVVNSCGFSSTSNQTLTLSVGLNSLAQNDFLIYPNPVENRLTILSNNNYMGEVLNISLQDIQGRVIYKLNHKNLNNLDRFSIDLDGIPKGTYFLSINRLSDLQTYRISKL